MGFNHSKKRGNFFPPLLGLRLFDYPILGVGCQELPGLPTGGFLTPQKTDKNFVEGMIRRENVGCVHFELLKGV